MIFKTIWKCKPILKTGCQKFGSVTEWLESGTQVHVPQRAGSSLKSWFGQCSFTQGLSHGFSPADRNFKPVTRGEAPYYNDTDFPSAFGIIQGT